MKVAYIAHPIGGDVSGNLKKIEAIARKINFMEPDVVPFAPYYMDCCCMNDEHPDERERCIRNDHALFHKKFIDELRVYGDKISEGVKNEIQLAIDLGIPVRIMNPELISDYSCFFEEQISTFTPEESARLLMIELCIDNQISWSEITCPDDWIKSIAPKAQAFFEANPNFKTKSGFESIASPMDGSITPTDFEDDEIDGNSLKHYAELSDVLNSFFHNYWL